MGKPICKSSQVYSLKPKRLLRAILARNYVNCLVQALMKVNKELSDGNEKELQKVVRYEVDMALAMSAHGISWSYALKQNLQRKFNVGKFQNPILFSMIIQKNSCTNHSLQSLKLYSNPNCKSKKTEELKNPEAVEESEDEQQIDSQLRKLRSLLPGGREMGTDELLSGLGSYIICLESQVISLRFLVENH